MTHFRTNDVCAMTGVTFRQLYYWTSVGYVRAEFAVTGSTSAVTAEEALSVPGRSVDVGLPGSGAVRYYPPEEVDIVRRILALVQAGLVLECAARIARVWTEHPQWPAYLGHGITIHIDPYHPDHPQNEDYLRAYQDVHHPLR